MTGGPDFGDEFERRLAASLGGRAERVGASPYAYRSVLRTAERKRRRRRQRGTVVACGAFAVSALAIPVGLRLRPSDGPTDLVASPTAGELPRLQPARVPSGFVLDEVLDVANPAPQPPGDYVQVFRRASNERLIARQSSLPADRLVPPENSTPVDVNGARAWLLRIDDQRVSLTWADDQALVVRQLHARNFTDAEVVDFANELQRNTDGRGIDTSQLPLGLTVVSEGELDEDESTARREVRYEGQGGAKTIDVTVRQGSVLELELLRATAPEVLSLTEDGVDRLLVSDRSDVVEQHSLYWADGADVIVEVHSRGLPRRELLDFARQLRDVGAAEWDSLLASADAAVVVRAEEASSTDADAAKSAVRTPGFAIEGITAGAGWRLSLPGTEDASGHRCLTLQVGATEATHCLEGDAVDAVVFDGGDQSALVVTTPGSTGANVWVDGDGRLADGRVGEVWIGWFDTDALGSSVIVELASGEQLDVELSEPQGSDVAGSTTGPAEQSTFVDRAGS